MNLLQKSLSLFFIFLAVGLLFASGLQFWDAFIQLFKEMERHPNSIEIAQMTAIVDLFMGMALLCCAILSVIVGKRISRAKFKNEFLNPAKRPQVRNPD